MKKRELVDLVLALAKEAKDDDEKATCLRCYELVAKLYGYLITPEQILMGLSEEQKMELKTFIDSINGKP